MTAPKPPIPSLPIDATLLPCPFCGKDADIIKDTIVDGYYVLNHHHGCVADLALPYAAKDEAIAAWNARALSTPDREGLVEDLGKAICTYAALDGVEAISAEDFHRIVGQHYAGTAGAGPRNARKSVVTAPASSEIRHLKGDQKEIATQLTMELVESGENRHEDAFPVIDYALSRLVELGYLSPTKPVMSEVSAVDESKVKRLSEWLSASIGDGEPWEWIDEAKQLLAIMGVKHGV